MAKLFNDPPLYPDIVVSYLESPCVESLIFDFNSFPRQTGMKWPLHIGGGYIFFQFSDSVLFFLMNYILQCEPTTKK